MQREKLIEAFESGDIGRVEFFELALETDLSMQEIEAIIAGQEEDL